MNLEQELQKILERNQRVELDKAWETSWVRVGFIGLVTYLVAVFWLWSIAETSIWLKAMVPVFGFLLSTLTLPPLKKWWLANH